MEKTLDKIVALAKNRGFVYPGSEIYGGLANTKPAKTIFRRTFSSSLQISITSASTICSIKPIIQNEINDGSLPSAERAVIFHSTKKSDLLFSEQAARYLHNRQITRGGQLQPAPCQRRCRCT